MFTPRPSISLLLKLRRLASEVPHFYTFMHRIADELKNIRESEHADDFTASWSAVTSREW
jgi:hypothetical protein